MRDDFRFTTPKRPYSERVRLRKRVAWALFGLGVVAAISSHADALATVGILVGAMTLTFTYLGAVYALEIARASDARMARIEELLERIADALPREEPPRSQSESEVEAVIVVEAQRVNDR